MISYMFFFINVNNCLCFRLKKDDNSCLNKTYRLSFSDVRPPLNTVFHE